MPARSKSASAKDSSANLGFEATGTCDSAFSNCEAIFRSLKGNQWLASDKLRNNMDAAEPSGARQTAAGSPKGERGGANQYKHVVLGLIFPNYISDIFEEHRAKFVAGKGDYDGANPEDQDEYKAENVFWVPPAARWAYLQSSAKQPAIGKIVDDAMVAIERENPRLKGVPKKTVPATPLAVRETSISVRSIRRERFPEKNRLTVELEDLWVPPMQR